MRIVVVVLAALVLAAAGLASGAKLVVLPRPAFPPPATEVEPGRARLALVSSRFVSPAKPARPLPPPPGSAPKSYRGAGLSFAIRQPPLVFLVYGRYLVKPGAGGFELDLGQFLVPPNRAWLEEIRWAREVDGVLYVSNAHLTYATATKGRNAYVTAIDLDTAKILWRSPALVANARSFVVSGDLIVSGYGFTREDDFLYLLDRRTGKVLDRLRVASTPEVIRLRGNRLYVRTYDRRVVARIVR